MVYLYVDRYEDSVQGSRRLLERALLEQGYHNASLSHDEQGKPFLKNGLEISISHTRDAAAVALSDSPVGVDLEYCRAVGTSVIRRVLSEEEQKWFRDRGARREDFLALWTLKESYYKYLGTGLPGFPNQTEFYQEDGVWHLRGSALRFFVWQKDLLTAALCCDEQEVEVNWGRQS